MAQQSVRTRGTTTGNLGVAQTTFDPAQIEYAVLVPKGGIIDAAARADIRNYLQTQAWATNKTARWQPTPKLFGVEPQGAESVKETSESGYTRIIREGGIAFLLTHWKGGKTYHAALRTFNNLQELYDVLFVDANNVLMGTTAVDANGAWAMKGFSLAQIFTDTYVPTAGSKGPVVKTFFSLEDASEWNDSFEFIELDFNFGSAIKGVIDVKLQYIGTAAPGPTVLLAAMAGAENLVGRFGTVLNVNNAWRTIREDTGATVPISTVSAPGGVGFLLSNTLSGIPSGTPLSTAMAPMNVLNPLGVRGYESNKFYWNAP